MIQKQLIQLGHLLNFNQFLEQIKTHLCTDDPYEKLSLE